MKTRNVLLPALTYCLLVVPGAAGAEDAASAEQAAALDDVVVTISRREQLQSEAVAPISVVDRQAIEQGQTRDLEDLFEGLPGVTISGGPRRDALMPTIRGLTDGRVVVRIDGARQNLQIRHRGQTFLDPNLLQRVEVLRGPASTLFGSGAIGGVVDFRTRDPFQLLDGDAHFGGRALLGYQSNADEGIGAVTLAGRSGDVGLLGSVTRSQSDDFEDGDGVVEPFSAMDTVSGLLKASWRPQGPHRLTATYLDYADDSPSRVTADRPRGDAVRRLTRQRTGTVQYGFAPSGSGFWDLDATVYLTDLALDGRERDSGNRNESELRTTGLDVFNVSNLEWAGQLHQLSYGVELYRDEQIGRENGQPDPGFASSEQDTVGLFLQDRILLGEALAVTLGARFDRIRQSAERDGTETSRFNEWSPQATVSYRLLDGLRAYVSYAEAFRAPNLRELFVAGEHFPGNTYLPNPELEPERARNKELGLNWLRHRLWTADDRLRAQLSVFQNDIEDFLEQVVRGDGADSLSNTTRFENVEDARLRGVEVSVRYDQSRFYLGLNGSLLRGDDEGADEPLEGMPADFVRLYGAWKWPSQALEAGMRLDLVARQDRLPPTTDPDAPGPAPGYAETDLFLSAALHPALQLELAMDNVFDRRFRQATNLINNPGRNLRVQLAYRF
ncbi:TonB-dependent hemoglobin/transferrin/lactoferrin family receptor [Algiphilus sp.]|uniref:TonB-dependent hemoglobin/transferrin/lactoferrin family receptor n=1 Tax=Algiphilus sp. TaxID=1872431 RepID=UPI003BA9406A